ncbi:MAG: hypothetical protein J6Y02_05375 [Pseudobutyrivibrio sp.]|nr:hypothetical protein [Pseudobutyrivibrio sp.]
MALSTATAYPSPPPPAGQARMIIIDRIFNQAMEREFFFSKDGTKIMVVAPMVELEHIIDHMDRFKYQYDNLLVIGNGFDLNLGLPTTYRHFVESYIFKRMFVKRMQEKKGKANTQPSLIEYLYGKKFCERWYDIEQALLEYVSKRPDGTFVNNVEEDKKDYELVCNALIEYFASILNSLSIGAIDRMRELPAGQLLMALSSYRNIGYTFNYTPIDNVLEAISTVKVHGEIEKETIDKGIINKSHIILGIETNDINSIAPNYTFLLKSNNSAFHSSQIAIDLIQSKNVIFFGHSMNQMDFGYFEDYLKMLASNIDKERKLTIITKDESSKITILDNIRRKGISVMNIYQHSNVEFVLTDLLSQGCKEEQDRFDNLLQQIRLY